VDVAVTGSSGLIGSALRPVLEAAGHRVLRIVRPGGRTTPGSDAVAWDPEAGTIDAGGLEGVGAVVNLAGEGIAEKRWNDEQKARIRNSRVRGTTLLVTTLAQLAKPPQVLVNASAVGIYGDRGDEILTEDSHPGQGFLAGVVREWEAATVPASDAGIRVSHLRSGEVLSVAGGSLKALLTPFKLGLGGRFGSGRQWTSWITIHDEVGAILHLLGDDAPAGPVNATAPNPVTNAAFGRALGKALHRPAIVPVPRRALQLLLGEMADELIFVSQRVLPSRLLDSGYAFQDPEIDPALERVLAP
jgi:uncharacterized protein